MADGSVNFSELEARVRKAFAVRGAFPVDMQGVAVPIVTLFNADSPGFHILAGRQFAGTDSVVAAAAGISKVLLKAALPIIVTKHTISNAAGAAGTFTLRFLGPDTVDAFAYAGNNTFWTEGSSSVAESTGLLDAISNDALTPGSVLWRGTIPALSFVQLDLPVHLFPGARVLALDETPNQGMGYAWQGYAL